MLISTCLEKYIITLKSLVTGDAVRQNNFIGIADMRFSGCISDGCGHIKFLFVHLFHLCFPLCFFVKSVSIRLAQAESEVNYYIMPARTTLAAMPAKVLRSAPASVHRVFVTFAVRKYTLMV